MKTDYIYDLVDSTEEELFHPLGADLDLAVLMQAAEQHDPSCWDSRNDDDELAVAEIRARRLGLFGNDYAVLWRCTWVRDEVGDDVWPVPWKHRTIETGTLEKPLSILP